MTTEKLQQSIAAWASAKFGPSTQWFIAVEPKVDIPPLEVRMLYAFDNLEYNISNGGWPQFLWNNIATWRALIETSEAGYELIGANEEVSVLATLRGLCETNEAPCIAALAAQGDILVRYANFAGLVYVAEECDWQSLFWSGIYEKRLAWLENNEPTIRAIIGLDHG
jgi:hypothetical protein